jgi:hypothetical protein
MKQKSDTPLLDEAQRINRELADPKTTASRRVELELQRVNLMYVSGQAVGEPNEAP